MIKKWIITEHDDLKLGDIEYLDEFVIVNAVDLEGTDFACWSNQINNTMTPLIPVFDYRTKTLNITALPGQKVRF